MISIAVTNINLRDSSEWCRIRERRTTTKRYCTGGEQARATGRNQSELSLSSYDPSFPKYSSTSAFFRKSSNTFSISSVVGIFGGINISGVKNGIYAAAARACAAAGESPFTSTPVTGCEGRAPSFFGRFEVSSVVDDVAVLAISVSSSGGCLRFGCVVSSVPAGIDESVMCWIPFPCWGRWNFGIGSSVSSPSDSRKFVYASAQSIGIP